jgi:hypothetical protein
VQRSSEPYEKTWLSEKSSRSLSSDHAVQHSSEPHENTCLSKKSCRAVTTPYSIHQNLMKRLGFQKSDAEATLFEGVFQSATFSFPSTVVIFPNVEVCDVQMTIGPPRFLSVHR